MSPVTEQWADVLRTHFALGEELPAVRAAAVHSAESGFFAMAGRDGEDGRPHFAPAEEARVQPGAHALDPSRLEALWTAGEADAPAPLLGIGEAVWRRESLDQVTDAVTGTELGLVLLREGDRSMWVVRTQQGICIFALVDGANEGHLAEARSLALDFDSFLVGQGY
ncbi:hypothetical protein ACFVQ0_00260 [Streptomyces sp. NPDC057900]|uniref:hypothetical protein n=1 Tax=Streptomyces sp. NPDC057900 TaxID=3346274 RepID=UPI0036E42A79